MVGLVFIPSIYVFPKHMDGLGPILDLKHFNCCMHIPTFKMPTVRQVWLFIQRGDYAFSNYPKDAYFYIPIVKHYYYFYGLFGYINCL